MEGERFFGRVSSHVQRATMKTKQGNGEDTRDTQTWRERKREGDIHRERERDIHRERERECVMGFKGTLCNIRVIFCFNLN